MKIRKTAPLRVMVINGHIGIPIRHGALQWALARSPFIHVILACEIRDGEVLRKALPGWTIVPQEQPFENRFKEAMTYVCFRERRFQVLQRWNKDITHGEEHPRRMTAARVRDRRTGQIITAAAVHCAPLGNGLIEANPGARAQQTDQLNEYGSFLGDRPVSEICLAGGDFNQRLWEKVPSVLSKHSAHTIFGAAGLVPAHSIVPDGEYRLMELFVDRHPDLQVKSRRTLTVPVQGMDHEVVVATLRIRKAK